MNLHKHVRLTALAIAVLLLTVGCVTPRIGEKWPALSLIEVNGQTHIAAAYTDQITLINPVTGQTANLLDTEGNIRVDQNNNPREWRVLGGDADGAQFFTDPIRQDDDTLLFASLNEQVFRVDTVTARLQSPGIDVDGAVLAEPAMSDTMLYVPFKQGGLQAVNRDSLAIAWKFQTQEGIWDTPLLHEGVLYVPSVDHFLYALDAETGAERWRADLEGGVAATPLLYNNHLYVGSFNRKLYKVAIMGAQAGEVVGTYDATSWVWGSPVEYDGTLYITDMGGAVHAVNPDTMQAVWSEQVADRGMRPGPLVTEQYVVAASRNGRVYWLNRNSGGLLANEEVEGAPELLSDMLLVRAEDVEGLSEDRVIVGTVDLGRMVTALPLEPGSSRWTYSR
jgi:outer membrane protein assembly factor BamB